MFVGIDLGTSAVKLLLMDGSGRVVGCQSEEYQLSFPKEGWSEQDPDLWLSQTKTGLIKLLRAHGDPSVDAIAAAGQMHGLVILDENDKVIRPAILWNDGRTASETEYLNNEIGKEKLSCCTGNIAFAGFTAPKILWVKNSEPENFQKIRKIMLPKDYLVYKLSGAFTTDYSDASGTLLLDVKNKRWSEEMLAICDVKKEQLPLLRESYEAVGKVSAQIKAELGIKGEAIVAAGAGDNAAAALGTGAVGNAKCNISVGTSGTVFITSDKFLADEKNRVHAFAHADGRFHLMGCMLSAASCNKWFMDEILEEKDYAKAQAKIKDLGENKVFFLPYLMGERSPHNDPFVRAMFYGMSLGTTRSEMYQSVLEGVAYGLRDSLEVANSMGLEIKKATLCGGGAKSPLWRAILANILKLELEIPESEEGPALGAAILAAAASGKYEDLASATKEIVKIKETVPPDPELAGKYDAGYAFYKKLYPAAKGLKGA
ncbi:xylulokinase [bacterium]|nr:xylulokinase [bacterium]